MNQKHCKTLHIASICPRLNAEVQNHIQSINTKLVRLCEDQSCDFVNADPVLFLSNGEVNDGYYADDVHLTGKGIKRVLSILPLNRQDPVKETTRTSTAGAQGGHETDRESTDNVRLFQGAGDVLSNLYKCNLRHSNMVFHSLEQLYVYRHARVCRRDDIATTVMQARDSAAAMHVGKRLPPNERWETIRFDIMSDCLQIKLEQCTEYRAALLESGDRRIIDNTPDRIWGHGSAKTQDGLNVMGQLHEIKRRDLRSGQSSHTTRYRYGRVAHENLPATRSQHQAPQQFQSDTRAWLQPKRRPNTYAHAAKVNTHTSNRFEPLARNSAEWPRPSAYDYNHSDVYDNTEYIDPRQYDYHDDVFTY